MQLHAFGGAGTRRRSSSALEAAGVERALYEDVNDPTGVAVLDAEEDPDAFVSELRSFLQSAPFAELEPKPELTMLGRTYAIGYEQDLEETLVARPGGACSTRARRGRSGTRSAAPARSSSCRARSRTRS